MLAVSPRSVLAQMVVASSLLACTDAPIPLVERMLPSLAFRGDTLFVLEQVIGDGSAVPVLRAYTISTEGCEWMPVGRG